MGEAEHRRSVKRKSCMVTSDLGCVGLLDLEEPDLPVWIGASTRRHGEYQHLRDAPQNLRELMQWLRSVSEFEEASALQCPSIKSVFDLAGPSWDGSWTSEAILSFQAAANASGVMHPPLQFRKAMQRCGPSMTASSPTTFCRNNASPRPDSADQSNPEALRKSHSSAVELFVVPDLIPLVILSDSSRGSGSGDEGGDDGDVGDDEFDSLALSHLVTDDALVHLSAGLDIFHSFKSGVEFVVCSLAF